MDEAISQNLSTLTKKISIFLFLTKFSIFLIILARTRNREDKELNGGNNGGTGRLRYLFIRFKPVRRPIAHNAVLQLLLYVLYPSFLRTVCLCSNIFGQRFLSVEKIISKKAHRQNSTLSQKDGNQ